MLHLLMLSSCICSTTCNITGHEEAQHTRMSLQEVKIKEALLILYKYGCNYFFVSIDINICLRFDLRTSKGKTHTKKFHCVAQKSVGSKTKMSCLEQKVLIVWICFFYAVHKDNVMRHSYLVNTC